MNLPNDICRCHGQSCDERETYERYLQRNNNIGERTPMAADLFPCDVPITSKCPMKIEKEI